MKKLRRFMTPAEFAKNYATQFNHRSHYSHVERIEHTVKIAQELIDKEGIKRIADFSAGDRAVVNGLHGYEDAWLHDITDDGVDIVERLRAETFTYDLFICTETIEHVEQPWTLLEEIAPRTRWLLLSTPLDEDPAKNNWEHYWTFEATDIDDLLTQSGFVGRLVEAHQPVGSPYTFQTWVARSEEVA